MQRFVVGASVITLGVLTAEANAAAGWRIAMGAVIGYAAGIALFHAAFGFTTAWRRALTDARFSGVKSQILMIVVACAAFFPMLSAGNFFGQPVTGFVFPVGIALMLGSLLFGIGMQLGGGCGSGTLYTAGGGSVRMLVTLAAFVVGSVAASAHFSVWGAWPALAPWSIVDALGVTAGFVAVGGTMVLAFAIADRLERRRYGLVEPFLQKGDVLAGPWPLVAGALTLAAVNIATLGITGAPWGITSAFALWGAKLLSGMGVDVASWTFWRGDPALEASVLADRTSVMNFGLMLGALAASGLSGRFKPSFDIGAGPLLAAVIGGLLMGYGARLATGCNIGAFFSGIASGSLHGAVWLIFALAGNALGVQLRPRFGLS